MPLDLHPSHCLHCPLLIGFLRIIKPEEFKVRSISIIVSTFLLVCLSTHSNLRITKPTQLQIPCTGHICVCHYHGTHLEARRGVLGIPRPARLHWGITCFVWCWTKYFISHHSLDGSATNSCLVSPLLNSVNVSWNVTEVASAESEPFQRPSEEISIPCQADSGIQMPFLA